MHEDSHERMAEREAPTIPTPKDVDELREQRRVEWNEDGRPILPQNSQSILSPGPLDKAGELKARGIKSTVMRADGPPKWTPIKKGQ